MKREIITVAYCRIHYSYTRQSMNVDFAFSNFTHHPQIKHTYIPFSKKLWHCHETKFGPSFSLKFKTAPPNFTQHFLKSCDSLMELNLMDGSRNIEAWKFYNFASVMYITDYFLGENNYRNISVIFMWNA